MRFFLDSVDPEEARRVRDWGLLDGATVSPGLISGESHDYKQIIRELSAVCDGPVLAEVTSTDAKGMYKEGREYHKLGKEVVIKLPMTVEGMKVLRRVRVALDRSPRRHRLDRYGLNRADHPHLRQLRLSDADRRLRRAQPRPPPRCRADGG